ncbi:MAG: TRAP transporter small permease [Selenomonadales bacterium]|jgi:TRAP-type mannitol/chloroaromatic compound transport system permease small subunit|nr:TRAP transporter small permease [Selenomonadales bacterium]
MPLFDKVSLWFESFNAKVESVLQYSVYALVAIVTLEVFVRFVLGMPLIWARDSMLWFYSTMLLLPVAYYYSRGTHISASDLVHSFNLSESTKATLNLINNIVLLAVAAVLINPAMNRLMVSLRIGETSILTLWRPPLWPFFILIPITFALISLQALIGIVRSAVTLLKEDAK